MAELGIKEGIKAYVEDLEREMYEGWGKSLSDDDRQAVMDSLAAFQEEELAFIEKAWNPENEDRLEKQMMGMVDDLIEDAKNKANNSGNGGEFDEEDLRRRINIIVDDGPDDDPGSYTLTAEIQENYPPENQDAALQFTIKTADMDFRVSYPHQDFDDLEVDDDGQTRNEPEIEDQIRGSYAMNEQEVNENKDEHFQPVSQQVDYWGLADHNFYDVDAVGSAPVSPRQQWDHTQREGVIESNEEDTVTDDDDVHSHGPPKPLDVEEAEDPEHHSDAKGKQPQKAKVTAPSQHHRNKNNHLWDVVVDAQKPHGQPAGYICKLEGCNGWQGKWRSRQTHFEVKHPEEWFAFSGRRAKVHACQVDGCGWSTTHGTHYLKKHSKDKHGLSEE